jgi:transmembrane carrier protein
MSSTEGALVGSGSPQTETGTSKKNFLIRHMISGSAAGAIAKTSVAPLERIKIILQTQGMRGGTQYKGIVDAALRMLTKFRTGCALLVPLSVDSLLHACLPGYFLSSRLVQGSRVSKGC